MDASGFFVYAHFYARCSCLTRSANHYIKCIHLVADNDELRRSSASLLLLAADKAKSMGSYITSLYFTKNAMFLVRLEKVATLSENSQASSRSRSTDSKDKQEQMNRVQTLVATSMSGEVQLITAQGALVAASPSISHPAFAFDTAHLSNTMLGDRENVRDEVSAAVLKRQMKAVDADTLTLIWSKREDYDLLYAVSFYRGELEYLCGHPDRAFDWFSLCLSRTTQLTQQIAIFRQLIRLKTINGDYLHALVLASHALRLLGVEIPGWRSSGKEIIVDRSAIVMSFDELQRLLGPKIQEQQTQWDRKRQERKKIAAGKLAAAAAAAAAGAISSFDGGASEDDSDLSSESDEESENVDVRIARHHKQWHLMTQRVISRLRASLGTCTDQRQQLIGFILNESIFPAYLFHPHTLQSISLFAVLQCLRHGLCGSDGFGFTMLGASLLATPIDHPDYTPAIGTEWGKLGLAVCMVGNNQTDYCRVLYANALFINSFTGRLERSIIELQQAMFIGSVVGDLHFVAHSSLAVVILQQYTSTLTEWEELIHQAQIENMKLLNDYAVSSYCKSMLFVLPSLKCGLGRVEECRISPEEKLWIVEAQTEAEQQGTNSLPLTLYAITRAKSQLLFHHPVSRQKHREAVF